MASLSLAASYSCNHLCHLLITRVNYGHFLVSAAMIRVVSKGRVPVPGLEAALDLVDDRFGMTTGGAGSSLSTRFISRFSPGRIDPVRQAPTDVARRQVFDRGPPCIPHGMVMTASLSLVWAGVGDSRIAGM